MNNVATPLLKLEVKGFCSLLNASLELQPGVTIIRGVSNEGKSSLLKALYQLLYNPSGRGFINQSTQVCDITLSFNGHTVSYHKTSKDSTKYTIDGEVFDKVVGPLQQVSDLLGFTQGELITSDKVNFWNQMSLPFLLYDSPKDRYEIISSGIYNLEDVRDLMVQDNKALSKSIDDTNMKLSLLQQDVTKLQSQIFDDERLRELTDKFYTTNQHFNELQVLLSTYISQSTQFNTLDQRLAQLNLNTLSTKLQHLDQIQQHYSTLLQQVGSYVNVTTQFTNLTTSINEVTTKLDSLQHLQECFAICPLCHNPIHNTNKEVSHENT